jgi:hypothetical protein
MATTMKAKARPRLLAKNPKRMTMAVVMRYKTTMAEMMIQKTGDLPISLPKLVRNRLPHPKMGIPRSWIPWMSHLHERD